MDDNPAPETNIAEGRKSSSIGITFVDDDPAAESNSQSCRWQTAKKETQTQSAEGMTRLSQIACRRPVVKSNVQHRRAAAKTTANSIPPGEVRCWDQYHEATLLALSPLMVWVCKLKSACGLVSWACHGKSRQGGPLHGSRGKEGERGQDNNPEIAGRRVVTRTALPRSVAEGRSLLKRHRMRQVKLELAAQG
jgi:hypothetical protein